MPLHRRNSAGHCEENYLEEITEAAELEDELLHQITCSASKVCFWIHLYGSFITLSWGKFFISTSNIIQMVHWNTKFLKSKC